MTVNKMLGRLGGVLAAAVLTAGYSATTAAATYNIILKENGNPLACATGTFTFTKTSVGTFPATSPTVNVPAGCSTLPQGTYTGPLSVVVEEVVSTVGDEQGPNVRGLTGTLTSGTSTLTFSYGGGGPGVNQPGARLLIAATGGTPVFNGQYFEFNATVPEPEMLWLLLGGVAGLYLVRRMRRRG